MESKIGTSDTEFLNENINTRRTNQNNPSARSSFVLLTDLYSEWSIPITKIKLFAKKLIETVNKNM